MNAARHSSMLATRRDYLEPTTNLSTAPHACDNDLEWRSAMCFLAQMLAMVSCGAPRGLFAGAHSPILPAGAHLALPGYDREALCDCLNLDAVGPPEGDDGFR